ncbi:leucine--tRNA ligase [Candidatus Woesearchaeota archaeon]|nr:leucine--tRNA ligase [Candidatus Woesearchaeota archaeon]
MEFAKIEKKWQERWEKAKLFEVTEDSKKPKYYVLEMFPYPSGSGLHMGHALNYSIGDIFARFKIMNGFNVLHPMGFDSFGLPAENAAIKAKSHPKKFTEDAVKHYIKQMKNLGLSYDWSRMVETHKPDYYKWDQWIFLKMFDKGLAYKKESPVNWCPKCNTVLANEQVHNGKCEYHGDTSVEVKNLSQWFLKTTAYVEELNNFDKLIEWPDLIKKLQKNWIGKSHGTEINFKINKETWKIFTTRADTLFGVTFVVVSAQHPKLMSLVTKENKKAVEVFVKKQNAVSEEELDTMEKEGVFTGSYAEHPLTGEKVPVYAGNFVLADYGSGMVMAVPAHDQRDFDFAKKYKIAIKQVIEGNLTNTRAYTGEGKLVNSGEFNGINSKDAIAKITEHLQKKGLGKKTTNYRLKDWGISRQRFWGTPIPIINCSKCGAVPVPEKDLPVRLPDEIHFTDKESPLREYKPFLETTCPKCGGKATRETDTMDTFVNSSWYYLRYMDAHNQKEIFDKKKAAYWGKVDTYIGGKEHACMHLIYIRFYTKFLRDLGLIKIDEPAISLFNQGMLHADDGEKMSKSRGNVVLPEVISEKYGIDSARLFLVSIASPDKDINWSDKGIEGTNKFLNRVIEYADSVKLGKSSKKVQSKLHKTIKGISEDIENFRYNLAVIKLRELFGNLEEEISKSDFESFLKILHPFCPHITEEMWEKLGNKPFISTESWPKYDESKIDEKAEAAEEIISAITGDIAKVKELANIDKLSKIILIVSPKWKYDFFTKLKELLEKTRNPGDVIKELMSSDLKKYGQEIMKIVPAVMKDAGKLPSVVLDQETELKSLKQNSEFIEKIFNAKVEVVVAETSKEQKAKNASPGKPAILVQ